MRIQRKPRIASTEMRRGVGTPECPECKTSDKVRLIGSVSWNDSIVFRHQTCGAEITISEEEYTWRRKKRV
jgi:hypothetical protein